MYVHELALLVAVATPFLAIAGLNLYLFVRGERGTLLLPSEQDFPSVDLIADATPETFPEEVLPAADLMPHAGAEGPLGEAANDSDERHAA